MLLLEIQSHERSRSDWNLELPLLASIFSEFAAISGLSLNVDKTVAIPLWEVDHAALRRETTAIVPAWSSVSIVDSGTYLGFKTGPGKATSSWEKPLDKYQARAKQWRNLGAGMQYATLAYNVFVISTALYVAQLEPVPHRALEMERRAIATLLPGPHDWITPKDAWYLHDAYGQTKSFASLQAASRAAQARVYQYGCHFDSRGDTVLRRSAQLKMTMLGTNFPSRLQHWQAWYQGSHCLTLQNNINFLEGKGITPRGILSAIAGCAQKPWDGRIRAKQRRQFQRCVLMSLMRADAPHFDHRTREKLSRWWRMDSGLTGPPGICTPKIRRRLMRLQSLAPPRVCAAVFRSLWNGWCTHRRFQQRSSATNCCRLGCPTSSEDSLEHYCRCPVMRRFAAVRLRTHIDPASAMDIWMLNSQMLDDDTMLTRLAILHYVVYTLVNRQRCRAPLCADDVPDAMDQIALQGVAGHTSAQQAYDAIFTQPSRDLR